MGAAGGCEGWANGASEGHGRCGSGGITDAGVTVTLSETAAIMDELYADFSRLADIGLTRATAS
jgi:hypothetical protein